MDLTVKDAARLLHTSEQAVYRWIHEGTLPSYRINDKYRLNRVELLEWATARNMKLSPEIFHEEQEPVASHLLSGAIRAGGVLYQVPGTDKASALKAVCDLLPLPEQASRQDLYSVLLAREALGSTAIGNGIAIPHPRSPLILAVQQPQITLAFLKQPVDFSALDGQPVNVLFTIISTTIRLHLQLLSHLMASLRDGQFALLLQARADSQQIFAALERIESGFVRTPRPLGATA